MNNTIAINPTALKRAALSGYIGRLARRAHAIIKDTQVAFADKRYVEAHIINLLARQKEISFKEAASWAKKVHAVLRRFEK